jgi:hypothetical protein
VLSQAQPYLSDEHFTVDGTLIEAWASQKSFQKKEDGDDSPGEFHGDQRTNDNDSDGPGDNGCRGFLAGGSTVGEVGLGRLRKKRPTPGESRMMNWKFLGVIPIGLGLGLAPATSIAAQLAAGSGNALPLAVAGSPSTPVIPQNGKVTLRVHASARGRQKLDCSWSADAGAISGGEHEVEWSLKGVEPRPGPYKASVKVSLPSGESASCSIQVFVAKVDLTSATAEERGTRETGRSFLVKGANEVPGYGLYSYLLLGSRAATESTRDRYRKTIQSYLDTVEQVERLLYYLPPNRLNVAYLPIEVAPSSAPTADWLIDNYDYARARSFLDVLPGNLREGPYFISALKRLSSSSPVDHYLFQDLSGVPSDIDFLWVREFLNQAAQERYWNPPTAELFVLRMRTTIGVLAEGLPEVQQSLGAWIAWLH